MVDRTINGSNRSERLVGDGRDDAINGNGGNDRLVGRDGNDTLNGGRGNDTLIGGRGRDITVVEPGTDSDTVRDFSVREDQVDVTAFGFANVDAVLAVSRQSGRDTVIELGNGDRLTLRNVSLNDLDARHFRGTQDQGIATPDTDPEPTPVDPGPVDPVTDARPPLFTEARDIVHFFNITNDSFAPGTQFHAGGGNDVVSLPDNGAAFGFTVETTFFGGDGHDSIGGSDRSEIIDGGPGHDQLFGGIGADHLIGGSGRDRLLGGADHDTLEGGLGIDQLIGGSGRDRLLGGAGHDRLEGGSDRDIFGFSTADFDGTFDTIVDFNIAEDLLEFTFALDGQTVTQDNIDQFVTVGATSVSVQGTEVATFENRLQAGADVTVRVGDQDFQVTVGRRLTGGDGSDVLFGGLGHHTLEGGAGGDTFQLLADHHAISDVRETSIRIADFDADEDRLELVSAVSQDFGITQENIDRTVTVTDASVSVLGTEVATFENRLEPGTDVTVRFGDQDFQVTVARQLTGDDGGNELRGRAGRDEVDIIQGLGGVDRLEGRAGDDILTGGGDADLFIFYQGSDHDVITDYNPSEDRIIIQGHGYEGFDAVLAVTQQRGDSVFIEFDAENSVTVLGTRLDELNENNLFSFT